MIAPVQLNSEGFARESRSIEQDSDLFLKLLHDPEKDGPNELNLFVQKGRQCQRHSMIPLEANWQFMTLSERKEDFPPKHRDPYDE